MDLYHPRTQVARDVLTNIVMPLYEASLNAGAKAAVDDEALGELTPPNNPSKDAG